MGRPTAPGGGPPLDELLVGAQVPLGKMGSPTAPGGGPPLVLLEVEPPLVNSHFRPGLQSASAWQSAPFSPAPGFWQTEGAVPDDEPGGSGNPTAPGGGPLDCG
jgi:hypothetical protein